MDVLEGKEMKRKRSQVLRSLLYAEHLQVSLILNTSRCQMKTIRSESSHWHRYAWGIFPTV